MRRPSCTAHDSHAAVCQRYAAKRPSIVLASPIRTCACSRPRTVSDTRSPVTWNLPDAKSARAVSERGSDEKTTQETGCGRRPCLLFLLPRNVARSRAQVPATRSERAVNDYI